MVGLVAVMHSNEQQLPRTHGSERAGDAAKPDSYICAIGNTDVWVF